MNRRNFLSTVASSPLLNVVSFNGDSPDEELSIKADSKKYSNRLFRYRGDEKDVKLYFNDELWIRDLQKSLEQMGIHDHCVFADIEHTSLIFASYSNEKEGHSLLYQIEPSVTVVSVREFTEHYTVHGDPVETREAVRKKLEELSPEKRGDWAL